jgi:4-hydroxy-3-methylbut-2-enyl diphosphate reductase IspH
MELRKAEVLGFCGGVRRAVRMIERELERGPARDPRRGGP